MFKFPYFETEVLFFPVMECNKDLTHAVSCLDPAPYYLL